MGKKLQLKSTLWHEQQIIKSCNDDRKQCAYNNDVCFNSSCQYYHMQCVGEKICKLYKLQADIMYTHNKVKRKKKKKIINIFLNTILPGVIISVISALLGHYFAIRQIKYTYDFNITKYDNNEYTTEDLLKKAAQYYTVNEYLDAVNIYYLDKMKTEPVAINNLAYMYENGIFFNKNIELARELYFYAATLGNKTAIDNYIIFSLQNPRDMDNVLSVLEFGYKYDSNIVYEFLSMYIYEGGGSVEDFFDLSLGERMDMLIKSMRWIEIDSEEYKKLKDYNHYADYSFIKSITTMKTKTLDAGYATKRVYNSDFLDVYPISTDVEYMGSIDYKREFVNVLQFKTTFIN